jgi:hypothetical protein
MKSTILFPFLDVVHNQRFNDLLRGKSPGAKIEDFNNQLIV